MREKSVDLSDYQILNVIKTYVKSMRRKVDGGSRTAKDPGANDRPSSSDEGMRKMFFNRIDGIVSDKIKKHETQF